MATGDIWETIVQVRINSEVSWNVMHWVENNEHVGLDEANIHQSDELASFVSDLFVSTFMTVMSRDGLMDCVSAQRIHLERRPVRVDFSNGGSAGQVDDDSLAEFTAAIIEKYCPTPESKPLRGRMYLPAIPQEAADGGILLASYYSDLQDAAEAFFAPTGALPGSSSYLPVVWSAANFLSSEVVDVTVNPSCGTQRRRRIKHAGTRVAEG